MLEEIRGGGDGESVHGECVGQLYMLNSKLSKSDKKTDKKAKNT
jgi:hypothetical protein